MPVPYNKIVLRTIEIDGKTLTVGLTPKGFVFKETGSQAPFRLIPYWRLKSVPENETELFRHKDLQQMDEDFKETGL